MRAFDMEFQGFKEKWELEIFNKSKQYFITTKELASGPISSAVMLSTFIMEENVKF